MPACCPLQWQPPARNHPPPPTTTTNTTRPPPGQVKLLESPTQPSISIADFLGKAVEPPLQQAVATAIQVGGRGGARCMQQLRLRALLSARVRRHSRRSGGASAGSPRHQAPGGAYAHSLPLLRARRPAQRPPEFGYAQHSHHPPPHPTQTHHHHHPPRQLLEDIGALNEREALTSLGRHLAALPLPPALGKMLLYGVLFSCLDPVLTVACVMAYRCGRGQAHAREPSANGLLASGAARSAVDCCGGLSQPPTQL